MTMVRVNATTLEYVGGSHNKFYRAFWTDNGLVVFQWGSQRSGAQGGQFKLTNFGNSAGRAISEARSKLDSKRSEGYSDVEDFAFLVDEAKLASVWGSGGAKSVGTMFDSLYHAQRLQNMTGRSTGSTAPKGGQGNPATPNASGSGGATSVTVTTDAIEEMSREALEALSLAATDPHAAMVKYAVLRERFETTKEGITKVESYLSTLELLVQEEVSA